ncbi:MAG: ABC transporter substrate-binding protein [Nitrososphaerales archaeon]|jgi:peptide/nickel transport system substrate-binding protein
MLVASERRTGIGRTVIVAIVVVVLIVAAAGAIYAFSSNKSTSTTTSSSSSGSNTSTSSATGGTISTLTIDDETWPNGNLNQLYSIGAIPYPNWQDYTVYQSLVTANGNIIYSNGTLKLLPMLASSWNSSASGDQWTFMLQKGVTFSNGDPFNAYQVWGELYGDYYLSGNSSGWAVGYSVFNMNDSNFGPSTIALMTQSGLVNPNAQLMSIMTNKSWPIFVVNQNEIGFNLVGPFPYFPQMWVQFTGLMFDTQYVLNNGGFGTPVAFNPAFNSVPIPGTGPYTVTGVSMNSYVQFTQNPTYWAKDWSAAQIAANPYMDPGHVKNVVITVKGDDISRYTDLTTGGAYIAPILQADWSNIVNNAKFSYFTQPSDAANIVGIALNTLRYPTNNTDFRQAIAAAINYTAVSDEAFLGTEGGGLTPMMGPGYPAYPQLYDLGNIPPYSYNVSLAKADIAASGVNTATLQPLEFRVIQGCGTCLTTAQVVQNDLAAVGIPVNVEVTPSSQYAPPLVAGAGTYPQEVNESQTIAQITWFGTGTFAPDEPTPADSWLTWVSDLTSANNFAIYSNPTVQICVNDLTNGTPEAALVTACTAAQAQVSHDAPYIWLGSVKLFFGGGSIVYNNQVVKSFLGDPVFSGQSDAAIFNTVQFVNGQ